MDWNALPDDVQVALAAGAMREASARVADQAEALAGEMEGGALQDRGGPDALRLLAALVRAVAPGEAGRA